MIRDPAKTFPDPTQRGSMSDTLTHFDAQGQAHMVDVSAKSETRRVARAEGRIVMQPATLARILAGDNKKGDVIGIARIAAFSIKGDTTIRCTVTAETVGRTGVEMEALTAVQVGLLTIYDMCKAIDKGMTMEGIRLLEKEGGKSGHWKAEA